MTTFPPDDLFEHLPQPALYWPAPLWAAPTPQANLAYQHTYPHGALPAAAATWPDGPHTHRLPTHRATAPFCRITLTTLPDGARIATIDDVNEYHTDPLTGLLDRRALKHDLRTETPGSVALLDIDHFKTINDTLGHAAGDDILCALATLLATTAHTWNGHAYRLGGDEFLLHTPRAIPADHLERLQQQFQRAAWRLGIEDAHVCATRADAPQHGNTIQHLILHADALLGDLKRDRPDRAARRLNLTPTEAATPDTTPRPRGWVRP